MSPFALGRMALALFVVLALPSCSYIVNFFVVNDLDHPVVVELTLINQLPGGKSCTARISKLELKKVDVAKVVEPCEWDDVGFGSCAALMTPVSKEDISVATDSCNLAVKLQAGAALHVGETTNYSGPRVKYDWPWIMQLGNMQDWFNVVRLQVRSKDSIVDLGKDQVVKQFVEGHGSHTYLWKLSDKTAPVVARPIAASPTPDWIIYPGKRVGPITANSSEADLKRIFGNNSVVHDADLEGPLLIPHEDPGSSLYIVWKNPKTRVGIKQLTAKLGRFKWRTHDGIHHQMTLSEVEKLHGGPLLFLPGGVTGKSKGRIAGLGSTLVLRFLPTLSESGPNPPDAVLKRYYTGPKWKTSDKRMAGLKMRLVEIRVFLKPGEQR